MTMLGRCGLVSNYEPDGIYEYRLADDEGKSINNRVYTTLGYARSARSHREGDYWYTSLTIQRRLVTPNDWETV